jgi:hypothetical protein
MFVALSCLLAVSSGNVLVSRKWPCYRISLVPSECIAIPRFFREQRIIIITDKRTLHSVAFLFRAVPNKLVSMFLL